MTGNIRLAFLYLSVTITGCGSHHGSALLADAADAVITTRGYRIQSTGSVVVEVTNLDCKNGYSIKLRKDSRGDNGLSQVELVANDTDCVKLFGDRPFITSVADVKQVTNGRAFIFINSISSL